MIEEHNFFSSKVEVRGFDVFAAVFYAYSVGL